MGRQEGATAISSKEKATKGGPIPGWVSQACFLGILVAASLVASLSIRFLLFGPVRDGRSGASYWSFVAYSVEALQNAFFPSLLVGAVVFVAYRFWSRGRKRPFSRQLVFGLGGLSVFYGAMTLIGYAMAGAQPFPRATWLLAWAFGMLGFVSYMVSRRIAPSLRDQLPYSRTAQVFIDVAVVACALAFAYLIRFDGLPPDHYQKQFLLVAPYAVLLYLGMNLIWGVHSFVWRFTSLREALVIAQSAASASLVALVLRILLLEDYDAVRVPFGVLVAHAALSFVGLLGARGLRRIQFHYHQGRRRGTRFSGGTRDVLLVGAGDTGMMLTQELAKRPDFNIVGFLDDDPQKRLRVINGIRVLGTTRELRNVVSAHGVREIILSMPTAPKNVARRVVADAESLGLKTLTVPSLSEIVLGKVRLGRLRPVRMEDLLGRASIEFPSDDRQLIAAYAGKRILVTGAAGSIGSELVRQLKDFAPSEIILLDKDENGLYEIGLEARDDYPGKIAEVMADIRDARRIDYVFARYRPQAVLHAAAYKHVPMMEHNPSEAIFNNVLGTRNIVEAAARHGAASFLLISTDKAVNPTNVMGASKRVAEMIVRRQAMTTGKMRSCCVRFGNVLGSRASVVPLFTKRIAQGRNIPVTHPEIRRYFMTIPEAVQLVLQAGSLALRGETFVLDMGDPVRIVDLAKDLIEQSGLVPGEDIEIEFTGLRAGEKLFEELLIDPERGTRSTKYPKIFVDPPAEESQELLDAALNDLEAAAAAEDFERIYRTFERLDIGYLRRIVPLSERAVKG
jgi:FlaA1/EpsC-like NDP-sugar epimerase